MKVSRILLLAPSLLNVVTAQETINLLSIIMSEANSVYTQVNSILSSAASAASAAAAAAASTTTSPSTVEAATTSSAPSSSTSDPSNSNSGTSSSLLASSTSSASSSSSSISSTSSSSSALFGSIDSSRITSSSISHTSAHTSSGTTSSKTAFSLTLSSPILGTSSVLGAAAEGATGAPSSSGSGHHSNLAIILGCVLGALALGLFILALIICCRRKRHGSSPRHSALSAGDDEVDTWRSNHPSGMIPSRGSSHHDPGVAGAAPLMSEHPVFRNGVRHENPFVPVPPPPRRTAHNSRPGMTDGMVPGDDPFLDETAKPTSSHGLSSTGDSHHKGGIAAGLAAAAVGAGLMHEHNKHNKQKDDDATLTNENLAYEPNLHRQISRRPVAVNHVNNAEPWPYAPVSPIEPNSEMAALAKAPTRSSGESHRSFSRDAVRANAAFDQQYTPHDSEHNHDHGLEAGVAGLAVGAAGGAALAHHRNQDRRRSRSSSSSNSNRRSRPPLAVPGDESDHSNSSGTSKESRNSHTYSDALASQPQDSALPQQNHLHGVPPAPAPRSRRNSGFGGPAPAAAAGAFNHANRPTVPSPLSSEVRPDQGYSPPRSRNRRSNSAPRYSFAHEFMGHDYGAYPTFPTASSANHFGDTGVSEAFPSLPQQQGLSNSQNPDKAIVGDNGYPHMNVPRRRSGGEYDFTATGPLGPQTVSPPPLPQDQASRNTTMRSLASDDSTWRMSDGMPGGWQRASLDSPRNSRDYSNRDSGLAMGAGRRRLRASDFAGKDEGHGYGRAL